MGGRVVVATHASLDAEGAEALDLGDFAVAPGAAYSAGEAGW